jgi:luciferase family oxidoreductase group 1
LAGTLGLPFAFAAHFAPEYLHAAAQLYRERFRPSDALRMPYLMVAVQVIAAETDATARRLFTTPQQRFLRLIRNQPVELLPPVDSMEDLWQDIERAAVETKLSAAIVGSNATVKAGLEKLLSETAADEVIVVTDTYDHDDRRRSYERLAAVSHELGVAV